MSYLLHQKLYSAYHYLVLFSINLAQCLVYIIGEEYKEDQVGSNVLCAAQLSQKCSFVLSPKPKNHIWKSLPTKGLVTIIIWKLMSD